MANRTTLYSPDGRPYQTSNPAEITRLKSRGYSEEQPRRSRKTPSTKSRKTSSSTKSTPVQDSSGS